MSLEGHSKQMIKNCFYHLRNVENWRTNTNQYLLLLIEQILTFFIMCTSQIQLFMRKSCQESPLKGKKSYFQCHFLCSVYACGYICGKDPINWLFFEVQAYWCDILFIQYAFFRTLNQYLQYFLVFYVPTNQYVKCLYICFTLKHSLKATQRWSHWWTETYRLAADERDSRECLHGLWEKILFCMMINHWSLSKTFHCSIRWATVWPLGDTAEPLLSRADQKINSKIETYCKGVEWECIKN